MSDIWLDYSGYRPDPHHMKRLGVTGVLRYLSADEPATSWKRITHSEKHAILEAGLDLILNFEWYEGRMLEGSGAGWADGKTAMAQAKDLGYPEGASIYFSHDTDSRDDSAVMGYLESAEQAMDGYYHADVYSGIHVVDLALRERKARYGWQTVAWSNGQVGRAHMYQNGSFWFNRNADEDRALKTPHGSWLQHGSPKSHPVPTPKPKRRPLPGPAPTKTPGVKEHLYKVKRSDTMARIAIRNHTTVKELLRLNPGVAKRHVKGKFYIKAGWVIFLPGLPQHHAAPKVKKYRIVNGDTLGAIAREFDTTVHQLEKWNSHLIKNPNVIHVGWIIRVG